MISSYAQDAVSLVESYRKGLTSPVDVLSELQSRIERFQPLVNAYSFMNQEASQDAEAAERRWGNKAPLGPLDGVPIIVKDNMAVKGMPASWGNSELATRMVDKDELPVARLREAGAIIIGKGNTPEFAVEGYTANATFGVTTNPYDTDLTPGGSSGAVAAAVASGQATLGIGTDGGGSIRRPAAYCGLIGLKAGLGHYPRANGLPQVLLDFEVVGPLTRTVRDSRVMNSVLTGVSRLDPLSRRLPKQCIPSQPLKVLYVPSIGVEPCDPVLQSSAAHFVGKLEKLGCKVTEGVLPLDLSDMTENWKTIAELGLSQMFDKDHALSLSASDRYREMAERGKFVTASQLWNVLDTIKNLRIHASQMFENWDFIVTPATASMPWNAANSFPPNINGEAVGPRGHAIYSGWVNAIGHPSVALPCAPSNEGVPIGVQLVGDLGSESQLLDIAEQCEVEFGGFIWPSEFQ